MRLNHSPSNCNPATQEYFRPVMCIKDILDKVESYDPTGLLTIATTFIHPLCRPLSSLKRNNINNENEQILPQNNERLHIQPGCIRLFSKYNYDGKYIDLCNDKTINYNLQVTLNGFASKSLQSSYSSIFLFYKEPLFQGDVFPIGKGIMIPEIKKIDIEDYFKVAIKKESIEKIQHNIYYYMGSVLLQKDYCLYMTIITKEFESMQEICSDIQKWNFGIRGNGKFIFISENGNDIQEGLHRDYFMKSDKITLENITKYRHFSSFTHPTIRENEELWMI